MIWFLLIFFLKHFKHHTAVRFTYVLVDIRMETGLMVYPDVQLEEDVIPRQVVARVVLVFLMEVVVVVVVELLQEQLLHLKEVVSLLVMMAEVEEEPQVLK